MPKKRTSTLLFGVCPNFGDIYGINLYKSFFKLLLLQNFEKSEDQMVVGFIGLGNLGHKLAATLSRNGIKLVIHDIDKSRAQKLIKDGASWATNPRLVAKNCDQIITCLPSPKICAAVMESENGVIQGLTKEKIWIEMSTTSKDEVLRLAEKVKQKGAASSDCPVSGGCHKAASGNISIFSGCERKVFERVKPILFLMGEKILHTGGLGTASILKVMTNYLATANLVTCCEALTTMKGAGLDLATTFEAIKISSGNSFVHETESQVILNGSRDINFTMTLVLKDIEMFQELAKVNNIPLDISPKLIEIFKEGVSSFGADSNSPSIIKRLERKTGLNISAPGFPAKIVDDEPEKRGFEVKL